MFVYLALGSREAETWQSHTTLAMALVLAAAIDAAGEEQEDEEYCKLKADPAIAVSDIEKAINDYCTGLGYRNLDFVLLAIANAHVGRKTAAKAI